MSQSGVNVGKVQKRKPKKKKQKQVLKAVVRMLSDAPQDAVSEFLGTGRTGRRNAMPDILGQHAQTSCSDLPDRLQSLCSVAPEAGSSQSGSDATQTTAPSRTTTAKSATSNDTKTTAPSEPPAAESGS